MSQTEHVSDFMKCDRFNIVDWYRESVVPNPSRIVSPTTFAPIEMDWRYAAWIHLREHG